MNLRHYLRGLGIGILVTAFILGITGKEEELTDAQIKLRAQELGMVEEKLLSDLNDIEDDAVTLSEEEVSPQPVPETETYAPEETEQNETPLPSDGSEKEDSEESAILPETKKGTDYYIVVTIEKGNSSIEVSKKLYEAGLVSSAEEYDQFLAQNGYDRKLSAGEHKIPLDAEEEQIARILCGME